MKKGDRVVVVTRGDEWSGRCGFIVAVRPDGYIGVMLDGLGDKEWVVYFWPHDIELEGK